MLLIGPLAAQALAGRFHLERPTRILAVATALAAAFAALVPLVLRLVIHGGAVVGGGYHRVLILTLLYAPAIPFATYWQLTTRSEHRNADRWRMLAFQATILFLVHLVLLMLVVILRAWTYVPLSTTGAFVAMSISSLTRSVRVPGECGGRAYPYSCLRGVVSRRDRAGASARVGHTCRRGNRCFENRGTTQSLADAAVIEAELFEPSKYVGDSVARKQPAKVLFVELHPPTSRTDQHANRSFHRVAAVERA